MKGGSPYVSTTNACKLCRPLGACVAFKGIEGCVVYLHGSQGCATYMRRYVISHFREPIDIASSSLGEKEAVFGGGPNLKKGILNVMQKYGAAVIGVATTCLTETIGDDVPHLLGEFRREFGDLDLPDIVNVSTPSYAGTHMEGFHGAVKATVEQLCPQDDPGSRREVSDVNLLPGFVSAEDLRHLAEIVEDFGLEGTILPDYSETLDGPALEDLEKIPSGGTPLAKIRSMGGSRGTIELGRTIIGTDTAGKVLADRFGAPLYGLGLPVGLRETDALFAVLEEISGHDTPRRHGLERGRLLDAYVDGHKYVMGKRVLVYGEEDLCVGLTAFLAEIGMVPVMVASGGKSGRLASAVAEVGNGLLREQPVVREGADFFDIAAEAAELKPDLVLGHSKGYRVIAKEWNIPVVRVGFPIHDRFGGQRILHLGYRGAQALFDRLVNAVIDKKQSDSDIGYGYI